MLCEFHLNNKKKREREINQSRAGLKRKPTGSHI